MTIYESSVDRMSRCAHTNIRPLHLTGDRYGDCENCAATSIPLDRLAPCGVCGYYGHGSKHHD